MVISRAPTWEGSSNQSSYARCHPLIIPVRPSLGTDQPLQPGSLRLIKHAPPLAGATHTGPIDRLGLELHENTQDSRSLGGASPQNIEGTTFQRSLP